MIHCATCESRSYCAEWGECRRDVPLVVRLRPRDVIPVPVDVPDPVESIVQAPEAKPPAPSHEPKGPMSTIQENTTRTRATLLAIGVINFILAFVGMQGADVGPVVDAVILGDWGNVVAGAAAILLSFFSRSIAGMFQRMKS